MDVQQTLLERWVATSNLYPWRDCAEVFSARGWVYGCGPRECAPDAAELRRTADRLFAMCAAHAVTTSSSTEAAITGRIAVYIDRGSPVLLTEALEPELYHAKNAEWWRR